ncbi:MAG TPA: hypothetical protein GX700_00345 [Paracoccus sp.]|nr:hypothetical protein [Paracoccus sp. (in: a-proteobacteria)]
MIVHSLLVPAPTTTGARREKFMVWKGFVNLFALTTLVSRLSGAINPKFQARMQATAGGRTSGA